jgi:predicted GNAT superfamily acetyltransferase
LLVSWRLDTEQVADACRGRHRALDPALLSDAAPALSVSPSGAPVRTARPSTATVLVGVPRSIEQMRVTDPELASAWRAALRDVLGGLLADGARVCGFHRAGGYVLDRELLRKEES